MRILVADGIDTVAQHSAVTEQAVATLVPLLAAPAEWVEWPAAMIGVGGEGSWVDNAAAGLTELSRLVALDDDDVVLIAYSGGNRIVHDFLAERSAELSRVRAVGLISDPFRPRGRWLPGTADPGGWGVCGQDYGPIPERTVWCAAEGDAVTSAAWDSLLRTGADLGTSIDENRLAGALAALRQRLDSGTFQLAGIAAKDPLAWARDLGRRIAEARVDIDRYFGGWHTEHYTRPFEGGPSLVERLCVELAAIARPAADFHRAAG